MAIPLNNYILTTIAFFLVGLGMWPIYPSIQHMAPINFGIEFSASIIGLQMSSAYIGATLMPMVFGHILERFGYTIMPIYLGCFLLLNILLLEIGFIVNKKYKLTHKQ